MYMDNHIFLFQVHKQPKLFERILSHLEAPNHYFAINIDRKSTATVEFQNIIKNSNNIIYISNENIAHSGFSQVSCTLIQIQQAILSQINFKYFHSLSGQDYPCVSVDEFDYFFDNNIHSYMMYDTLEEYQKWKDNKYLERLEHFYFTDELNHPIFQKFYFDKIINKLIHRIPRKYENNENVWGGWNWFSLHKSAIDFLMDYITMHPEFVKRFKYTHCPDELFFTTIFHNVIGKYNIETTNCLRYIDWYPNRPYSSLPLILNEEDYTSIVESKSFFCRKVEEGTSDLLMKMLDEKIINKK